MKTLAKYLVSSSDEHEFSQAIDQYLQQQSDIHSQSKSKDPLADVISLYQQLNIEWQRSPKVVLKQVKDTLGTDKCSGIIETSYNKALKQAFLQTMNGALSRCNPSDDGEKIQLDVTLHDAITRFLLAKGSEKIVSQQRKLSLFLHPDRKHGMIKDLDDAFYSFDDKCGKNYCFTRIAVCVDEINNPQKANVQIEEDIKKQAEDTHSSFAQRYFATVLFDMYLAAKNNSKTARELRLGLLTLTQMGAPIGTSLYCISLFSPQLITLVSIMFALKIPGYMEGSTNTLLDIIGTEANKINNIIGYSTTSLLALLVSANHKAATLVALPVTQTLNFLLGDSSDVTLIDGGMSFKHSPIKLIAVHLERYNRSVYSDQIASAYRQGFVKTLIFTSALEEMKNIDDADTSMIEKLEKVESVLINLQISPEINGSGYQAVAALKAAQNELEFAYSLVMDPYKHKAYLTLSRVLEPLIDYCSQVKGRWVKGDGPKKASIIEDFIRSNKDLLMAAEGDNYDDVLIEIGKNMSNLLNDTDISKGRTSIYAIEKALDILGKETIATTSEFIYS